MEYVPWLRSLGFEASEMPLDGTIHRLDRGKTGKSGWFIGWREPFEYAIAGDWRTGERFEMTEPNAAPLSRAEKTRRQVLVREAQQKAEAMRDENREAARLKADIMWRSAVNGESAEANEYVKRKKIAPCGARVLDGELLVPMIDADGELWGVQRILADGTKLFLKGQRVDGTFHRISGNHDKIFVCEGFATGASIHMATGAAVYCAFSAVNLEKVAEIVSMMHADAAIAIAGDDDKWSEGNAGRAAAVKASRWAADLFFPTFKDESGKPTDFNDLHCLEGLNAVAEVLKMGDADGGNVRDLGAARKKKTRAASAKPKMGELFGHVVDAVMGIDNGLPPFPVRYLAIEPERGIRVPVIVSEDESIQIVRAQALATDIAKYCHALHATYAFTAKQCREVADLYLALAKPIPAEDIKIVRWCDEPGLTYRRLPWKREDGPAPTWELLLGRMSNAHAFIEWVGSLFFAEADLQQYCFVFGVGGEGKGSISRFLAKVFGRSYRSKQPPTKGDKFWSHGILGARLVVFPDCNDTAFLGSGLFKSLTGGDPIDVEAKGEMSFTTRFNAKYMVIANERPAISSQKSDLRRIIFCELEPAAEYDPLFEDRLWLEGGAFLAACVRHYETKYPDHGPIKTDLDEIREWTDTLEEAYQETFAQWFVLDPAGEVVPGEMQRLLRTQWPKDRKSQLGFLKFLETTHGIRKRSVKKADHVAKFYKGISVKVDGNWSKVDGSCGNRDDFG